MPHFLLPGLGGGLLDLLLANVAVLRVVFPGAA